MDRNDTSNKAQRAIGLLKEQLERDGSDLSQAIAELCAAHPDLEAVLETLGSAYRAGQAATASRSLHELVRTRLGDPDTITFVLDPEDESNTGSAGEATDVEATAVDAGLGAYSVQDEVARGGMGVIYRVRDTELNRTLAMKVMAGMPPESSDVSAVNVLSRFLEEAQLTAQLDPCVLICAGAVLPGVSAVVAVVVIVSHGWSERTLVRND